MLIFYCFTIHVLVHIDVFSSSKFLFMLKEQELFMQVQIYHMWDVIQQNIPVWVKDNLW